MKKTNLENPISLSLDVISYKVREKNICFINLKDQWFISSPIICHAQPQEPLKVYVRNFLLLPIVLLEKNVLILVHPIR